MSGLAIPMNTDVICTSGTISFVDPHPDAMHENAVIMMQAPQFSYCDDKGLQ